MPKWSRDGEVVVFGAGPAGLAAAITLRRSGRQVTVIEPEPFPRNRLGESLDWSAPRLLRRLGVDPTRLTADRVATPKRGIAIQTANSKAWKAHPPDFFAKWPFKFEVLTLHVDRPHLDRRLFDMAAQLGTEFMWDRVSSIDVAGEHVVGVSTLRGNRISGRWFVDASGQAQLLGRRFQIPKLEYGARKVCLWTYFDTLPLDIRTTFYGDTSAMEYVTWIWEIPISPERTSVGCVMSVERFRSERNLGKTTGEILREELLRYARFHALVSPAAALDTTACSYRSYVHTRVSGPNWFLAGEAASLPDPLTANGVTAAFRHGSEAAALIIEAFDRGTVSARERYAYEVNVRRMGHAFNHSIETGIYEWPVRCGVGSVPAQRIYTAFSYTINALYSKFQPQTRLRADAFGVLLMGVWLWFEIWALIGRAGMRFRRPDAQRQTAPLRARA
jgi:menaquinone-9 beta-reductase